MKRPLALIGLTSMLVLTVCFYADAIWLKVVFALSLAGFIICLVIRKSRKKLTLPVFFAVVLLAITGFGMFSQFNVKPLQNEFSGKDAEVTAVLLNEAHNYRGSSFYTLKTKSINGEHKSFKIMLGTNREVNCEVGDTLKFTAELESADYGKNLADKVYLNAYTYENIETEKAERKPFYYYIVKLRQGIRHTIYLNLKPDVADFSAAVLLGDSISDTENYEVLRRAGLTHIVVVSGLHLSIITMLYEKTFGKCIKNKYINVFIAVLIVLFFLLITGFGKSSIRAAIMLFVLLASTLFKRKGDSLNSLGFAAIILCLYNPYIAGDVGVLLSFCATFGIVVFSPPLYEFLSRRLKPVYQSYYKFLNESLRFFLKLLATTFTASICTLPVNVLFFGRVSLVQIFSNLIVVPLIQWFMISVSLCALFAALALPFVTDFVVFIADAFGNFILYIAKLFASLPVAYVKADYDFVLLWIIAVILLFSAAFLLSRNGRGLRLICVLMSVLIFISGSLAHIISSQNKVTVYVTPANQGQSVILSSKDGNVLLYSIYNSYTELYIEEILQDIYTEKQLMVCSSENISEEQSPMFDYKEVLMYDNICKNDLAITLWDKGSLYIFERKGNVYQYLAFADTSVLILPPVGDAKDLPLDMQSVDVLITSGLIDNIELLSFETLISNGNDFKSSAVIDSFRNRSSNVVSVSDTIDFDIVG